MADSTMDLDTLKSIIKREHTTALGQDGGQLSAQRLRSLEYYEGVMTDLEVKAEGRSKVTMRSVMEAVEWVLPALLRIFTASDKIAEFEPIGTDDKKLLAVREAAAEQATTYISYIFNEDNPGFIVLHDWFKDALIGGLGWIKVYWDENLSVETATLSGLDELEYQQYLHDPNVDIVEQSEYPAPSPEGFSQDAPQEQPGGTLYDCTLRIRNETGRVKIMPVPPEEILFSRRAKNPAFGPLPFICHKVQRNRGDLLGEGYDAGCLDEIGGWNQENWNTERTERHLPEDDNPADDERADPAMRVIWIEENYIRVDYDGDGIPELRKVVTASGGANLLTKDGEPDIELIDEVPLLPICPVPMPHKLAGLSLADLVMDLQQIKTTLVRQALDNIYLTNNARHYVDETKLTENTLDDLLTSRPGGIVRGRGENAVVPLLTPFVAEKAFQLIEYIDQTQEVRTGVSRRNQGLNPDDLNKTAAAAAMYQEAAAQRVELVARVFAFGVKALAQRILGLVTRYQQHKRIIRLTGEFVPMDPRQWSRNMDTTVSVGLGTGNKDQILMHLEKIAMDQAQIVQAQGGVQGPIVYAKNVYELREYGTEMMGIKKSFYTDPTQPPPEGAQPPQQQPDPEMMKAHGQMQIEQMKAQASAQALQAKMRAEMQHDQTRLQAEMAAMQQKAQLQFTLDKQRQDHELALETQKAQHEVQIDRMKAENKMALEQREIELRAAAGAYTAKGESNPAGAGA